jgi:hypothetical protein
MRLAEGRQEMGVLAEEVKFTLANVTSVTKRSFPSLSD